MLPAEDLLACVYVLIDDLITAGVIAIPPRPGPVPACSDAELLAIALVRHVLGRRSEAGFLAEVARDWTHLFPALPHQSEANRRIRWLRGAFELLRRSLAARLPADDFHGASGPSGGFGDVDASGQAECPDREVAESAMTLGPDRVLTWDLSSS